MPRASACRKDRYYDKKTAGFVARRFYWGYV